MYFTTKFSILFSSLLLILSYQNCSNPIEFTDARAIASIENDDLVDDLNTPVVTPEDPVSDIDAPNIEDDKILCDPFQNSIENCDRGFFGDLYTLDFERATLTENRNLNAYFELGYKVNEENSYLVFPQLFYPTQEYNIGFKFEDDFLKNEQGELLFEYFALDLKAVIYLSEEQEEGWYQFALVSDDGSTFSMDTGNGAMQMLVDNDGYHSAKMKCSEQLVYLEKGKAYPVQLQYFQGPRNAIALNMMWRRFEQGMIESDKNADNKDSCGITNANFFGDFRTDPETRKVPLENTDWYNAYQDDWRILTADNLLRFSDF
ncbi:MAG: hypothetical protein CL674_10390 [Bdellovibrionaceae bacterium]|nr:hypothetical protein [Pseudobdellovibrionaceae bacterium]|tara:strand:- start:16324 stop:17277 length:954 start_codon:yes stop_codon:yes gene_type:complete